MEILRIASLTCLQPLSLRELTVLAPYAAEVSIPAGRRVLLDGPFAQELALVVDGRGSVRCAGETVAEFGPGDAFGTLAPSRAAYPTATVTALSALRLITFSTRDVRYLRRAAPDTLQALVDVCAQRVTERASQREAVLANATAA
jgi:CRP-like cAMP-binding protein